MTIRARIIILVFLLVLIIVGGIFLYYFLSGKIKIGAEAVVGCQNAKMISAFFGSPGSKIVDYDFSGNIISIHEAVVPFLDKVQKEIKDQNVNYNFSNVTSFNPRWKRGGRGRSLHSWGIAIDINPGTNPQGGDSDIPKEVIDIFRKHGFFWGGDWPGRDRDPMHFEWYGAAIAGQSTDKISKQKILDLATAIDGSGSPNNNGEYYWIVPAGVHEITAIGRGYSQTKFSVELTCFSQDNLDIVLEPLPSNVPGAVAGNVKIAGSYPLLVPANVYLDGRLVSLSNLKGNYYIPNIKEGKHKIEAKIMFFPGSSTTVEVVPGDNLKNINIIIGR